MTRRIDSKDYAKVESAMQQVANIIYSHGGPLRPQRIMIPKELFQDFEKEITAHYKGRGKVPIAGGKAIKDGLQNYLYMGVEVCLEDNHDRAL